MKEMVRDSMKKRVNENRIVREADRSEKVAWVEERSRSRVRNEKDRRYLQVWRDRSMLYVITN